MSFSNELKIQALVASARRCCVCKEYKGRNIEVHHIRAHADGGDDTFENAIPLCFDCHADAGHYNPRHPRGTKFSPQELREHRDAWYRTVKEGRFTSGNVDLTLQYFLCNSFDIVWEILEGNFENFPLSPIKLVKNEHYRFLVSAKSLDAEFSRESDTFWKQYDSIEDFLNHHPSAKRFGGEWKTTHWEREIELDELKDGLFDKDFVTNYLIRHGARAEDIAKVSFSEHGCADSYYETLFLRGAKTIFATLINCSEKTITVDGLWEHFNGGDLFVELGDKSSPVKECILNGVPLVPGESLVVPICTVLTPFEEDLYGQQFLKYQTLKSGQSQDTRSIVLNDLSKYPTIGPYHNLINISGKKESQAFDESIRDLSIFHVLQISRYWECGSCPHILAFNKHREEWQYIGELFSGDPDTANIVQLDLGAAPFADVEQLAILEIEQEMTHIAQIVIDGKTVLTEMILRPGQLVRIDVSGAQMVKITGHYSLYPNIRYKNSKAIKNKKLVHVLGDINTEPNNAFQPTTLPPLRAVRVAAESGRYALSENLF